MRSTDPPDPVDTWKETASEEASYVEKALGLVLLLVLVLGCIFVLKPFLKAIFLAVTLRVSTWPLFRRAERMLGGRQTAAAMVMTLITAAVLVLPLVALGANLADDILAACDRLISSHDFPGPSRVDGRTKA